MAKETENKSSFFDLKVGDVILAYDEYSRDGDVHRVKITSVEYDDANVCEENPKGMTCYGDDLDEEEWGDDYVTVVTHSNFIEKAKTVSEEEFENFLIGKNDRIDNAAYNLICALVSSSENEEDDEEESVEWNMEHIGEVVDMVKSYLEEQGFQVCHPYYEADMNTDEKPCCECDSCSNKNCQMRKN